MQCEFCGHDLETEITRANGRVFVGADHCTNPTCTGEPVECDSCKHLLHQCEGKALTYDGWHLCTGCAAKDLLKIELFDNDFATALLNWASREASHAA